MKKISTSRSTTSSAIAAVFAIAIMGVVALPCSVVHLPVSEEPGE